MSTQFTAADCSEPQKAKDPAKVLDKLKQCYITGRSAAARGVSRESVFYRDILMVKAWHRGFDSYHKLMREIKK